MSFDLKLENGDLKFGISGELEIVSNETKLIQDILKILFTSTGSQKLHPWYGSPLIDNTVGLAANVEILNTIINNGINYALSNLQTLQGIQEADGQYLTPREVLRSIDNIEVFQDDVDPRQLVVVIEVTSRSGSRVEEAFTINL